MPNYTIPAFLHNLFHWGFSQAEGNAKGTVDEAKVEANPIVQVAVNAAVSAGQSILLNHVGNLMSVEPTLKGVAGVLSGLVDGSAPAIPDGAKEPLKLLLGSFLTGTDFLSAPATVPVVPKSPPLEDSSDPTTHVIVTGQA